MTHGAVKTIVNSPEGLELEIVYTEGSHHIIVPPNVKATGYDVYERSTLKPGTMVSAVTRTGRDGVLRAGRLALASP